MAAPNAFSHVVLKTFQLAAMRDWYCAVLDAHVVHETPGKAVFLTYDEEHHRVAITQLDGAPPTNLPKPIAGLLHLAYTYSDIRTLLGQFDALRGKGIAPIASVNHGPTVSLYYVDPDGNRVELLIDRFADVQEAIDFMGTPGFQKNPAGVDIDPAQLFDRMEAGAADEELIAFEPSAEGFDPVWFKKHLEHMGF
jgi:catechol-2,3-dioxygenase